MAGPLKIFCMNVRGLADRKKRTDVFNWLKKKKMSVYCLTDIHISPANHNAFLQDWGNEIIINSFLVESLIRVMYWVVATILNWPFKPLNTKFCIIFLHISVH